jgi:hypothetical protein
MRDQEKRELAVVLAFMGMIVLLVLALVWIFA